MTTTEGNKLIAEFMGAKDRGDGWVEIPNRRYALNKNNYPASLQYNYSWDWLMPAWVKFRNLRIKTREYNEWEDSLSYHLLTSDEPRKFFERLSYAIQWYNEQKQSPISS